MKMHFLMSFFLASSLVACNDNNSEADNNAASKNCKTLPMGMVNVPRILEVNVSNQSDNGVLVLAYKGRAINTLTSLTDSLFEEQNEASLTVKNSDTGVDEVTIAKANSASQLAGPIKDNRDVTQMSETIIYTLPSGASIQIESNYSYDPYERTYLTYCEGDTYTHSYVSLLEETMTLPDGMGGTSSNNTSSTEEITDMIEVLSVNEQITTTAGTFTTIHVKRSGINFSDVITDDGYEEAWFDIDSGAKVLSKSYNNANEVIQSLEATSLTK